MQNRKVFIYAHMTLGLIVGSFFYSPLHHYDRALPLYQWGIIPLTGLTGAYLWQQAKIHKDFKKLFNK